MENKKFYGKRKMFCDKCGKELNRSAKFCPNCGNKIVKARNHKSKMMGIAAIIGCIVVGTFIVASILLGSKDSKDNNKVISTEGEYDGIVSGSDLSDEDFNECVSFYEGISEIGEKYLNENGYIDEEKFDDLWVEILGKVESGRAEGIIDTYEKDDLRENLYVKFKNGVQYMLMPAREGYLSSGGSERIITLEPNASSYQIQISALLTWIDKEYNNLEYSGSYSVPTSAELLNNSNLYTYVKNEDSLVDNEVTVEKMKTLSDYKVVIWEGHGGYAAGPHSALVTADNVELKSFLNYEEDIKKGNIVLTDNFIFRKYAVTSRFFDKYLGRMDGSVIFLGACYSGKDEVLAESFLDKGASAVVGYSDSVSMEYEMMTRANIFYRLSKNDTLQEAVNYTKRMIGAVDCFGKYDAEIVLFVDDKAADTDISGANQPQVIALPKKEKRYLADGSLAAWREYEYDEQGRVIKDTLYYGEYSFGDIYEYNDHTVKKISYSSSGEITGCSEYKYDNSGNKIEEINYGENGNIKDFSGHWSYSYNEQGKETEVIEYYENGSIRVLNQYEYDFRGRIIQYMQYSYDLDGKVDYHMEFNTEYDGEGKYGKTERFKDGFYIGWNDLEYDEAGNEIKNICYDANDNILYWNQQTYDNHGNRLEKISYDESGNQEERFVSKYEYDEHGNIIRWENSESGWKEVEYITYEVIDKPIIVPDASDILIFFYY